MEAGSTRLREAQYQDAEALSAVERAASLAAFTHIFPPERYPYPDATKREQWRSNLAETRTRILLVERGADVVGFISFTRELLEAISITPGEWGGGLGHRLYGQALEDVRRWGVSTWRLWAMVENYRARRFYERLGWRVDGRRSQVPFPPYPALVGYALDLDG